MTGEIGAGNSGRAREKTGERESGGTRRKAYQVCALHMKGSKRTEESGGESGVGKGNGGTLKVGGTNGCRQREG